MRAGIYRITIGPNVYFGQSVDLDGRRRSHISTLKRGIHRNTHLQRSYDKYQEFEFEILLTCPEDKLNYYESGFLNKYANDRNCCNFDMVAPTGTLRKSEETRQRMKAAAFINQNNPTVKSKVTAAKYKPVMLQFADGSSQHYTSLIEAAIAINMHRSHLGSRLTGKLPWPSQKNHKHRGMSGEYLSKENTL